MTPHPRDTFRRHELGWIVRCPICGNKSKRLFRIEEPDSLMNAERYWADHETSEEHRAATTRGEANE